MKFEYIKCGGYYIPDLKLPEGCRSIGKWNRMCWDYLEEYHPVRFNILVLSCELWSYLADLNEQAQQRTNNRSNQTSASFICESLPVSLLSNSSFANSALHSRIAPCAAFSNPKKLIPPYHTVFLSITAYL